METFLGKIEVIWNWCCWYEKIIKSFLEIISGKLETKLQRNLRKTFKNRGNTSH